MPEANSSFTIFFVKICFHLQLVFGNKGPPKVKGNSARKIQYTNMEYNQ